MLLPDSSLEGTGEVVARHHALRRLELHALLRQVERIADCLLPPSLDGVSEASPRRNASSSWWGRTSASGSGDISAGGRASYDVVQQELQDDDGAGFLTRGWQSQTQPKPNKSAVPKSQFSLGW